MAYFASPAGAFGGLCGVGGVDRESAVHQYVLQVFITLENH